MFDYCVASKWALSQTPMFVLLLQPPFYTYESKQVSNPWNLILIAIIAFEMIHNTLDVLNSVVNCLSLFKWWLKNIMQTTFIQLQVPHTVVISMHVLIMQDVSKLYRLSSHMFSLQLSVCCLNSHEVHQYVKSKCKFLFCGSVTCWGVRHFFCFYHTFLSHILLGVTALLLCKNQHTRTDMIEVLAVYCICGIR